LTGCPSHEPTPAADGPSPEDVARTDGVGADAPCDDASTRDAGDAAVPSCAWAPMQIGVSMSRMSALGGTSTSDLLLVGSGTWEWMVLSYDGTSWHNEIQGGGSALFDIAVVPGGDAFAVGASSTGSIPLIVSRQRSAWTQSTLSEPGFLRALWADASGELFAVGWFGALFRYSDGKWHKLAFAPAAAVSFYDVWGTSAKNLFAVGSIADGTVYRYDGSAWTEVWQGKSGLRSIWGSSEKDIYALGGRTLIHYDGVAWSNAAPALAEGSALFASVWGTSARHVVAGGSLVNQQGKSESLILIYDGVRWTRSRIDSDLEITTLWGLSSDEMFAIGSSAEGGRKLFRYACQ